VAIDFSKAKTVHSSILGPLLKLQNTISSHGGMILLSAIPADLHFTLCVIKCETRFQYVSSVEEIKQNVSNIGPTHVDPTKLGRSKPVIYQSSDPES
jgi:anti-anti-sigma regulatory factor